jgi:hypothetical protein
LTRESPESPEGKFVEKALGFIVCKKCSKLSFEAHKQKRSLSAPIKKDTEKFRCPCPSKAPEVGLEPTTLRLTAGCSAIELLRNNPA